MKRLYFSIILTATLLGLFFGGSQPVQAHDTAAISSPARSVILADMDDYRYYMAYMRQITAAQNSSRIAGNKLRNFIKEVNTGSSAITGIYVPNVLEMKVLQQPSGNAGWVSESDNTITQFGMASSYNTTGLLAHNTHAGAEFFDLKIGQTVVVVKGNGEISKYRVDAIHEYQALQPTNPYSNFVDLETNESLTATDLFYKVYTGSHHLTFQTCIEKDGEYSWGRLFVIATPLEA
jgi:hypothetical protein